jgi:hypothetical protein
LILVLGDDRVKNTAAIQATPLIEMGEPVGDALGNHEPLAFTAFHVVVLPFTMDTTLSNYITGDYRQKRKKWIENV